MGAILGGTMRAPFTGVIFALELTHDVNMLLPLLVAVVVAHGVHRAGAQALDPDREDRPARLSTSAASTPIDPLEILFAREVMRTSVAALPDRRADGELRRRCASTRWAGRSGSIRWST